MTKLIIKHLIYGIVGGCVIFVMIIMFWDLTGSDRLHEVFNNFTVNALGAIAMSTGFSMSAIVYEIERIALWLKISINVLVGFGVFFFVGYIFNVISLESPIIIAIYVVVAAIIFIGVCFIDYWLNKREAKRINAKIGEQGHGKSVNT